MASRWLISAIVSMRERAMNSQSLRELSRMGGLFLQAEEIPDSFTNTRLLDFNKIIVQFRRPSRQISSLRRNSLSLPGRNVTSLYNPLVS